MESNVSSYIIHIYLYLILVVFSVLKVLVIGVVDCLALASCVVPLDLHIASVAAKDDCQYKDHVLGRFNRSTVFELFDGVEEVVNQIEHVEEVVDGKESTDKTTEHDKDIVSGQSSGISYCGSYRYLENSL